MHRWARFIVVLVLAAALPLQGIAAATLQLCAPPPEAAVPVVTAHHVTVAAHSSPHATHHQHHGASETVRLPSSDPEHPHAAPVAESKCSVCAACCAGAALPASSIEFGDAAPEDALLPSFQSPTPAFLTAGLERPPRPFLA